MQFVFSAGLVLTGSYTSGVPSGPVRFRSDNDDFEGELAWVPSNESALRDALLTLVPIQTVSSLLVKALTLAS